MTDCTVNLSFPPEMRLRWPERTPPPIVLRFFFFIGVRILGVRSREPHLFRPCAGEGPLRKTVSIRAVRRGPGEFWDHPKIRGRGIVRCDERTRGESEQKVASGPRSPNRLGKLCGLGGRLGALWDYFVLSEDSHAPGRNMELDNVLRRVSGIGALHGPSQCVSGCDEQRGEMSIEACVNPLIGGDRTVRSIDGWISTTTTVEDPNDQQISSITFQHHISIEFCL